jgi:hypothetical protein
MTPTVQILLLILGSVISVLMTVLISILVGIRADLKVVLEEQKDMRDRVLTLETEHKGAKCSYQRGA